MTNLASARPAANDRVRWDALENLQAALLNERFQRDVGLPFSTKEIERLGGEIERLALEMAPDHRDDDEARGLLSRLLQASKALKLGVELQAVRDSVLTTTHLTNDGSPITPYNVHQALRLEDDAEKRQAILAHFCQADPRIEAADEMRRAAQWEVSQRIGMNPLDEFVASENMTVEELRFLLLDLCEGLGQEASDIQLRRRGEHFPGLSGPLTWADSIAVGLRGDARNMKRHGVTLESFDSLASVLRVARNMGFAADMVHADLGDRPKKYPGATAYRVRIPSDVRIRVKPQGDAISDAIVLYHEMGHALHFISVDPDLPLPARIGFNFATSETFSYWLQSLWSNPLYLIDEIGLSPDAAAAMVKSANEGLILSAVQISAAALAIIDYWRADKPSSLKQIERFVSVYFGRFLGYAPPELAIRWYTGSVLALEMNTLGYPVALARLGNLLPLLESRHTDWWNSADACAPVLDFMRGGRRAGFPPEMLNPNQFIERVVAAHA